MDENDAVRIKLDYALLQEIESLVQAETDPTSGETSDEDVKLG